ncbi:MAG: DUF6132 family protein [Eubacteriales bacterium]|jgi:hypothetical protein|nr:DUF6132 family protein [Eubacteriales bacterium]
MNDTRKSKKRLRYLPLVALALLGAVGGYLFYRFVGCASGTCAITSNPYISTIYGGVIGALLGSTIAPMKRETDKEESTNG